MRSKDAEYQFFEKLSESNRTIVYRGKIRINNLPVVLKLIKEQNSFQELISKFRHEFEIGSKLSGIEGIIRYYNFGKIDNDYGIVMEDIGAVSLSDILKSKAIDITTFLSLAVKISGTLHNIHQQKIIHKNINPANILWNIETNQIRIIDFGISSETTLEIVEQQNPEIIEGTLAYISPEQTGRMNRIVDYRTDLYSLGITFYEVLTGELPFKSTDPLELLHSHIAKKPRPLHIVNNEIPEIISEIVMKLISKNAENRYYSAFGLKHDLEKLAGKANQTRIKNLTSLNFKIAEKDYTGKFQISQKLYSREPEISKILKTFNEVVKGEKKLVMINGYPGVGKSALVDEIQNSISPARCYFIKGKYDQFKRDIPYNAIIQAFRNLIEQLLTESDVQLALWKKSLLKSLGPNARVIIEIIPELKYIIDEHGPLQKLNPNEAQNRFMFTFCSFIRVFAKKEKPLVIFLDDLQWSDISSLKLIQEIMQVREFQHLLIIGAFRANEVNEDHPLMLSLNEIKKTTNFINIFLKPLDSTMVNQMIADSLQCNLQYSQSLAETIFQKTRGNPFFITEFLKNLYQKEKIRFRYEKGAWFYEPEEIRKMELDKNVVEFLTDRLKKLPSDIRNLIGTAACIGNRFDLEFLSLIYEEQPGIIIKSIFESISEGIISPPDEYYHLFHIDNDKISKGIFELKGYYIFQHDQLRQTAYLLIDKERREKNHLLIGRQLLKNKNSFELENSVIEIVSHLNKAVELIKDGEEKVQFARLNLEAGIKAKTSIAYQSALEYLTTGLKLLPDNSWDTYYDLTFKITKETSECAYLCGKFDMAEEKSQILFQQARSSLEKAEIIRMQLVHYTVLEKLEDAIHIGIKGLRLLGIRLPYKPNSISVIRELLLTKWNLRNKQIADLVNQPEITDSNKQLIMNILMEISPIAYMINNENLVALTILKQVNISLKYGNTPSSAYAYGTYGAMILGELLGDLKSRYEFGKLSLKLNERFNDQKLKGRVLFIYTLFIHPWNHPGETVTPYYKEIIDAAYQAGDIYYLVFSCVNAIRWNPEMNLKTFYQRQINEYLPVIEASKHQDALDFNKVSLQMAANLLGITENRFSLSDKNFDENECLERMKQGQNISGVAKYYLYKLQIHYFYEDYLNAVELISLTETRIKALLASQWTVEFCFYSFLSYTAVFNKMSFLMKQNTLRFLRKRYNQMKKWSDYNPANYLHFTLLMKAELARLKYKFRKAFTFYNLAIKNAKTNGFIRYEALANELSAKFQLGFGQEKIAAFYMKEALLCYSRWGAVEKIRQLNEKYHTLSESGPETDKFSEQPDIETNILQATAKINNETLDLETILKTSQSISGEINLGKLLRNLIKYLLENSGAQKAFLILENAGQFTIEAEGNIEKEEIKVLESIPLPLGKIKELDQFTGLNEQIEKDHILPFSILQYTIRTKKHLVLQNAYKVDLYKNDPYIITNRTKSVMCMPIINKGKFLGLLYLENNLTTAAFSEKRLKTLKILASQAAVSIENAHLYQTAQNEITERKQTEEDLKKHREHLEEMVKERTKELEEKNKELERYNRLFEGREFRIKELRNRVKELEGKWKK